MLNYSYISTLLRLIAFAITEINLRHVLAIFCWFNVYINFVKTQKWISCYNLFILHWNV